MSKNKLLMCSLLAVSVLITGCSNSNANATIYSHYKKKMATRVNRILQTHTAPNMDKLKIYANTSRSKYLHTLISNTYKNCDLIPSRLVDPAIDEDAKSYNAKAWSFVVSDYNSIRKRKRLATNQVIKQMIRIRKKSFNNPFYLITNLPSEVEFGIIRNTDKVLDNKANLQHTKTVQIYFPYFDESNKKALFDSIVKDLDAFIVHDSSWTRTVNIKESEYQDYIDTSKYLIFMEKARLKMLGNSKIDILKKEKYKRNIEKNEKDIKLLKAKLKDEKKENINNKDIEYLHQHIASSGRTDTYRIYVRMLTSKVVLLIDKVLHN